RVRRVAVTGLGAVSPFGAGVKAYWNGLSAGVCAIRPVTLVETEGFRCRIAAEVPDGIAGSPRRTRADRFALAAAREALEDAGLSCAERAEAALVVGAVGGGMLEAEVWYWERFRGGGPTSRRAPRSTLPFSHADVLGNVLGLEGPRETLVMACSSGAASLALAADLIADGVVATALAGGVDALTRICFMGFNALKLLCPEPCRPFDRDRRGMSIGEGAAFVVLEELGRARARGARIYATLAGHGSGPREWAHRPRGRGLRERARHGHAAERSDRGPRDPRGIRPGAAPGELDEVHDRPHHGGGGCPRGGRDHPRAGPRGGPADGEPRDARPRRGVRLRAARRPRGRGRVRDLELLRLRWAERDAALRAGLAMARVAVTGVGVVTVAVTGGREQIRAFLASSGAPALSVPSSALGGLIDETEARRLSRICQLSVAAARIALADAGLGPGAGLGLVIGAEFGDVRSTIAFVDGYLRRGPGGLSALLF